MKTKLLLLFTLIFCSKISAQDSVKVSEISLVNTDFKDYVIAGKKLYATSKGGHFVVFNISENTTELVDSTFRPLSITKSYDDSLIYLGLPNHNLFVFNTFQKTWGYYGRSGNVPEFIAVSRLGQLYSADKWGIYNTATKKKINTEGKIAGFTYQKGSFFSADYVYRSNDEKLYFSQGHGEFGTTMAVLDMKNDTFCSIIPYIKLFHWIQSIFEDDRGNVYSTSGLNHLGGSLGGICQKSNLGAAMILMNYDFRDTLKPQHDLFIGGGAFNTQDSMIYIFSNFGFKRGKINSQTGRIQKLESLFNPKLKWYGEPLALGAKMSVRKMEFLGRKLIFLTSGNGIGIYDLDKPDVVQFIR